MTDHSLSEAMDARERRRYMELKFMDRYGVKFTEAPTESGGTLLYRRLQFEAKIVASNFLTVLETDSGGMSVAMLPIKHEHTLMELSSAYCQ